MTIQLPIDKTDLCEARFYAASVAEQLLAAYWLADRNDDTARYLLTEAHSRFAQLAEALGYSISRKDGDAAAHRTREMNAELPQATRDVLVLKGMI